jgi:hypothetical protein
MFEKNINYDVIKNYLLQKRDFFDKDATTKILNSIKDVNNNPTGKKELLCLKADILYMQRICLLNNTYFIENIQIDEIKNMTDEELVEFAKTFAENFNFF